MENTSGLVGKTLGQYRIIERIGEGGMATVFKALQPGLNREIALKVLSPHFANKGDFSQRFERESQAIGNLHHPHILPIYDSGQDKGYSYLAMRYIAQAKTLADVMKKPLSMERIVELISQIAAALDHAHQAGIIHRDIKPSNILMDGDWALLSDFGLVKIIGQSVDLTDTGVGMGTPSYMSPEQGMGKKVDHRTDIYALGIILYEMLTGQVPHKAETPIATVMNRVNEPLPLPRSLNLNIPEAVERVLLKALAKNPTDRFASVGQFANALKMASSNQILSDSDATVASIAPKIKPSVELPTEIKPIKFDLPSNILGVNMKFIYSDNNLAGTALAVFMGMPISFLLVFLLATPWALFLFFIIPALYGVGYLVMPPASPQALLRASNEATVEEVQESLEKLISDIRGKVAPEILHQVESIKTSITDILPYIMDMNSIDHNIHVIRQTALDYLPETLENYLNLPKAYANLHPVKDGKTAKQLLIEQLNLLDERMKDVATDLASHNTQQLIAHGRFLEDKFYKTDLLN